MKEKSPKSYYKLSEENKRLKAGYGGMLGLYILALIIFFISFMIETATVGDYILSKINEKDSIVWLDTSSEAYLIPHDLIPAEKITIEWHVSSENEILASGECVDIAQTIINMLKRRYVSFDRIKAAMSDNHVQIVRQNIDGTIDFLKLEGRRVIVGESELPRGFNKLIKPDDFLEAIEYFRPEINIQELQAYLDNKYKKEHNHP